VARLKPILFVCSQNKLRSPTAEQIYSRDDSIEVASAGLNHDAEVPLGNELVDWADTIFVMEKTHRNRLRTKFKERLRSKHIVSLDIPDDYAYMDAELIRLLEAKVPRFL